MGQIFQSGIGPSKRRNRFLSEAVSLCAMLHALNAFRMNQRRFQNFSNFLRAEPLAKLLKARGSRHSGQAKRDPESSIFEQFWIPAPAPDPIRGSPECRSK